MTFGSISCSDSKASTTKKKKKKSVQRIKLSPKKKKCLRDHKAREGNTSHDLSFWKAGLCPCSPAWQPQMRSQASVQAFCDKADQAGMALRRKSGLGAGGALRAPRGLPDHVPTHTPSPELPTRDSVRIPFFGGGFSFFLLKPRLWE